MPNPTKMDYSKLFGFDMVADHVADGVNFQDANIGARLGAKVGKATVTYTDALKPVDIPSEVTHAAGPVMVGLGGRTVSSS